MATFTKFNSFIEAVFEKQHNFASDSVKFYLTNAAPVATNTVKADIAEIAAGNGYTAGGYVMTVTASSQTSGTYTAAVNVDQTITATGGTLQGTHTPGKPIFMVTSGTGTATITVTDTGTGFRVLRVTPYSQTATPLFGCAAGIVTMTFA